MIGDNIMLAVPVGDSFDLNMRLNLYSDEKKKEYGYLGLYINKSIRAVGKVIKVITIEIQNGELNIPDDVTDDERCKILEDQRCYYENKKSNAADNTNFISEKFSRKIFFVDRFYKTDFKNTGDMGIIGSKKFDLKELLSEIPETTEEIANQLRAKTFKLGKNQSIPSSWKGVSFETCVALAKEHGIAWKDYYDPKINRMRLIMALKAANIIPSSELPKSQAFPQINRRSRPTGFNK